MQNRRPRAAMQHICIDSHPPECPLPRSWPFVIQA